MESRCPATNQLQRQKDVKQTVYFKVGKLKRLLCNDSMVLTQGPEQLTTAHGAPLGDKLNSVSVGPRGPLLLQDHALIEELAHFDRERIPERVVHAKGAGAFGHFEVTHDISQYCKAAVFSRIGKQTPLAVR